MWYMYVCIRIFMYIHVYYATKGNSMNSGMHLIIVGGWGHIVLVTLTHSHYDALIHSCHAIKMHL